MSSSPLSGHAWGWCAALCVWPGQQGRTGRLPASSPLAFLRPRPLHCGPDTVTAPRDLALAPAFTVLGAGPGATALWTLCPRLSPRPQRPAVSEGLGAVAGGPQQQRVQTTHSADPSPPAAVGGSGPPEGHPQPLSCPAGGAWPLSLLPFLQGGGCHGETPGQRQRQWRHHQSLLAMQALGPPRPQNPKPGARQTACARASRALTSCARSCLRRDRWKHTSGLTAMPTVTPQHCGPASAQGCTW